MKLNIEKSVIVVTPTIGSPKLADAIRSVQEQTYSNIKHLIVIDGVEYWKNVMDHIPVTLDYEDKSSDNIVVTTIPFNTGKDGFYGHRIYAGIPHLLNADYIFFLDEDNWYDPDHVRTLVEVLGRGNHFAYSLRKIYQPDKTYVCDDNCEALGKWPIYFTHNNYTGERDPRNGQDEHFLVDTSSFAFERNFLQQTCHLWHSGWGGDRRYLYCVKDNAKWDTNYKHTLCYRLDGNPGSVDGKFFIEGNKRQLEHYNNNLPWIKR